MFRLTRAFIPALAVLLLGVGPALAQQPPKAPPRHVLDEAHLFSEAAREKANAEIAEIKRRFGKDLLIETLPRIDNVPEDNSQRARFFEDFADEKAKNYQVDGIYVLIATHPKRVEAVAGGETRRNLFTRADANELAANIIARLKANEADAALLTAVDDVRQTFARHAAAAPAPAEHHQPGHRTPPAAGEHQAERFPPWVGWVCLGIVALVVVWVILGVIRGVSGGAGGYGGGYGGGPGYGYPGGGGGGFLSSMLGGMFGAAAGMWMYNHFFGGGTPSAFGGDAGAYGAGAAPPSDVGGDYQGGGGDWDGGAAAGGERPDAGAGGGDWGGGGDAGGGGGGDWGGGGGDVGGGDIGGGGGDWGGGGGDFGGGGGDFGGGGGDW